MSDPVARLQRFAELHLGRLGRDRALAVVFQVELRQSTKFMAEFSTTRLREYLGLIRDTIALGQARGDFRTDVSPTLCAKLLFGALDEMATNWILTRPGLRARVRRRAGRRSLRARRATAAVDRGRDERHTIRSAAVLGAGTMGAQIAAHLTNAGVPVMLFDVTADAARQGLDRLKSVRPEPFFTPDGRRLIQTAGFDDLPRLAHADWIIEAVVEDLDVKQDLLGRVARHASSNRRAVVEHVRDSDSRHRRRPAAGHAESRVGHALLQSAAVSAASSK